MNRAPTTNGDATSALAKGGYDAYFAQLDEHPGSGAASAASTSGPPEISSAAAGAESTTAPESGTDQMSSAAPHPPVTGSSAGAPQGAVSPPQPTGPPPAAPETPAVDDGELAGLRERAATAHQQAAAEEQQAIARRQQQSTQGVAAPPPGGVPVASPEQSAGTPDTWTSPPGAGSPPAAPQPYTAPAQTTPTSGYSTAASGYAGPQQQSYTGYSPVQGAQPAAPQQAGDASRVPDRIHRPAYEATGRIEVLPPALASAELLAEIAAVRQAHLRSNKGVRGALNKVGFNIGLSPAEQEAENRRTRIRRQLSVPYQIAVVSVKGGVGRTTTAAGLGSTFAKLRPDRVIAIDANPDFGDLSSRTTRHQFGLTLRDLAQAGGRLDSFSAVHSYTAVNTADLAVVASPWSTDAGEALTGAEYQTGVEILRRHYNLLVVDCGTGVLDSSTNTVLRTSDAVVVVTPATVGGVTGAVATLNWLSSHGFDHLIAASMVAIVRQHPVKPTVDIEAIEKLFASAQRPTVQIPFDPHLAEGGEIDLRMLDKETALAFENLAAGLADDFPGYVAEPSGGDRGGMR
ncbi:MinD/ParA family ATP-binding protein [Nocardia sienata]|uniref:MinD/ParA family ATP-binding protein n=1 Tax=Nocardia sienata TaxID=248552 RepID=UPI000AF03AE9|nr:MinD/ParA family protein [Nocardia sienata]